MAKSLATLNEVLNAAMALLARREYSRSELQRRLSARVDDPQLLDAALQQLQQQGYQSDHRFAEMFVRSRLAAGYGRLRIRQALQQKGIDRDCIEQVLAEQPDDSRQRALDCCRRRFGMTPAADPKAFARRMRFLVNRGFSFEDARYAIEQAAAEADTH